MENLSENKFLMTCRLGLENLKICILVHVLPAAMLRKEIMYESNSFIEKLDHAFPLIVFVYGGLLLLVLNLKVTRHLGEKIIPREAWNRLKSHSSFAWLSFFVGGIWVLENLWFS